MDNNTLKITEENLSAVSCDDVLRKLEVFGAGEHENIVLDLSDLGFVDPFGMAMLCLIGRHLSKTYWDITCILPADPDIESYLTRMKVFESLTSYVTMVRAPQTGRPPVLNESLLEVMAIEQHADIEQILGMIEARVVSILSEELHYTVREITGFKNVVAELCHNILDHSGDKGFVVAQRYINHKLRKKFVIIGVCDLGMGIKESLSVRHDVSQWSHSHAIKMAVQKEFSRGDTRGLGLYIVRQICQENGGSLHIRSGDERVYIREDRIWTHPSGLFPGTQVSITLYEKD